ncbi:MAG: methionine synthase, partial [Chloroflexi bacterium]|nr:methionine synthase [Chloroflexota bacterium]
MSKAVFNILPTMIGSMPHTDPQKAMLAVIKYLPQIAAWPQLPKRDYFEQMASQFSQKFPGLVLDTDDNATVLEQPFTVEFSSLYEDYLAGDFSKYDLSLQYASGFNAYMNTASLSPTIAKGQMTGPLTFGTSVKDEKGKAIIYDQNKRQAICMFLRLKAMWQESRLRAHSPHTLLFLDEPMMVSFGSAYLPLSQDEVTDMLDQVMESLQGLKGLHICGRTDWEMLLKMPQLDVLNFDAYKYAYTLELYQQQVKDFFRQGKAIAWGIVPTNEEELKNETVASLRDRLEEY